MQTAIFGDSYADRAGHPNSSFNNTLSWPEWLKAWGYNVNNFSKAGTDLWFSYRRFLEQHQRFDRVIFLATQYHRLPVKGTMISSVSAEHLQWHRDRILDDKARRALTAMRDHLLWSQDPQHTWDCIQLMISDIKARRPDCLIIKCFDSGKRENAIDDFNNGIYPSLFISDDDKKISLWQISEIDHRHYKMNIGKITEDHRHCHINEDNNKILAQEFRTWLDDNKEPLTDVTLYKKPSRPLDFYFTMPK